MRLNFVPTHVFRETPQVSFFDAGVKGSNGSDVVIHHGNAISPPDDGDFEQYYVHRHQIDHNLVIECNLILLSLCCHELDCFLLFDYLNVLKVTTQEIRDIYRLI